VQHGPTVPPDPIDVGLAQPAGVRREIALNHDGTRDKSAHLLLFTSEDRFNPFSTRSLRRRPDKDGHPRPSIEQPRQHLTSKQPRCTRHEEMPHEISLLAPFGSNNFSIASPIAANTKNTRKGDEMDKIGDLRKIQAG
jgi:hypothetical protein